MGLEKLLLLPQLSIRSKIIGVLVATNVLGLGIAFTVISVYDLRVFRAQLLASNRAVAKQVATYLEVPVYFKDPSETRNSIEELDVQTGFLEVFVFNEDGEVFDHFAPAPTGLPVPDPRGTSGYHGTYLEVLEPVVLADRNDEFVGTVALRVSTAELDALVSAYLVRMAWVLVGMLGVSIFFSFVLGRLISRPILQLADVARTVSHEGDYSLRVRKIGRDEIAELCDVFNAMLDQIHNRQIELERSNRELDHFARAASHDLKAPLRGIATLATWIEEDLENESSLSATTAERLHLLKGRVKRMEALITGILDYARVGRMDATIETTDFGHLVHDVVELLAPPPGLVVEPVGAFPTLKTRKVRLQQVLANLIGNAIKHHHKKEGRIVVGVENQGEWLEVRVTDDGPGIPRQYHDKIFQIFQTLQPRDVVEGTGVGLALVKKIVEAEGGAVRVESEEGQGTTFLFTWPVSPPPSSAY